MSTVSEITVTLTKLLLNLGGSSVLVKNLFTKALNENTFLTILYHKTFDKLMFYLFVFIDKGNFWILWWVFGTLIMRGKSLCLLNIHQS